MWLTSTPPPTSAALQFMRDTIYKYKIAPAAVTGWEESNVQDAFDSGQAVFAINWPYLFPLVEAKGSPIAGKVAWIPFPLQTVTPPPHLAGTTWSSIRPVKTRQPTGSSSNT